jgi:uncharacterized protein YaiL (DUF2058 family)
MALHPEDRYTSAAAVSSEIERWLADEPVEAHRDSLSERAARFTRRHRSWVQAGSAAAILITVAAVAAAVITNEARERAQTLATKEAVARRDAQRLAVQEAAALERARQLK